MLVNPIRDTCSFEENTKELRYVRYMTRLMIRISVSLNDSIIVSKIESRTRVEKAFYKIITNLALVLIRHYLGNVTNGLQDPVF